MIRGTTPTYTLVIPGVDLTNQWVLVTVKQGKKEINKHGDDLIVAADAEGSTVICTLSQEETLSLRDGAAASVQARWIDANGVAGATESSPLTVEKVLNEEVIRYADDQA
jgi:hypothetical protein